MSGRTGSHSAVRLAVGIVVLEFAAAVGGFISATLLPVLVDDLDARSQLALLIAGSTVGLFVALPLAPRALRALGGRATLLLGVGAYLGGAVLSALAGDAWVYAIGRLTGGAASGLLAVFGISAAIRQLDEALRVRVIAASSAMWILPALVGPSAALGLEHLAGWRWTLLAPVPIVLFGRLLLVRATGYEAPAKAEPLRLSGRTLLMPLGVAGMLLGGDRWPVAVGGAVLALVGVSAMLPTGTARFARGTPAALAAMSLFALGYFGAQGLITVLLTEVYRVSLGAATVVLSAAPLAWAVTSLVAQRRSRAAKVRSASLGMVVSAVGVLVVAVDTFTDPDFGAALFGWTLSGVGVGLAYPALYILSTTSGPSAPSGEVLASAVLTAEEFGSVFGQTSAGTLGSLGGTGAVGAAYVLCTLALGIASYAAGRARPCEGNRRGAGE